MFCTRLRDGSLERGNYGDLARSAISYGATYGKNYCCPTANEYTVAS
jgi:hypothetical protein